MQSKNSAFTHSSRTSVVSSLRKGVVSNPRMTGASLDPRIGRGSGKTSFFAQLSGTSLEGSPLKGNMEMEPPGLVLPLTSMLGHPSRMSGVGIHGFGGYEDSSQVHMLSAFSGDLCL